MIDIEKLETLAKAATPGPWQGDRIDGTVKYDIISMPFTEDFKVVMHGDNGNASDGGYGFTSEEDENYVLAANPATVLALIAEVRALREDADRYRWLRDHRTEYGTSAQGNDFGQKILWLRFPGYGHDVNRAIDAARGAK